MDPVRRRESVCRNLFGSVDHEQLRKELKVRLNEIIEQDSRRWNFNFQAETPLPGRFQWEEVPSSCAAPLYRELTPLKGEVCAPNGGDDDGTAGCVKGSGTDQENCSRISNTNKCPAQVSPVRRKRTPSRATAKPGNNARITDFFAKRRRTTDNKSILTHLHTGSSEGAQCRTIR